MHLDWNQIVELLSFVVVLCLGATAGFLVGYTERRKR